MKMFKKSCRAWWLFAALFCFLGCKSLPPLPAVDLSKPGWKIQRGQAIWTPKKDAPEIAGELLVATNADGHAFVQFTKTPFPFAIAQTTRGAWQIEFAAVDKRFTGRGKPPQQIIWLQLPRFLAGAKNSRQWAWQTLESNRWVLRNRISGESLEGFLTP